MNIRMMMLVALMLLSVACAVGQNWESVSKSLEEASKAVNVSVDEGATRQLKSQYESWEKGDKELDKGVIFDVVADYLELKKKEGDRSLSAQDVQDFSWSLVENNTPLTVIDATSEGESRIKSITIGNKVIHYDDLVIGQIDKAIVIPDAEGKDMIVEMDDNTKVFISADLTMEKDKWMLSLLPKVCRIDITTKPAGAQIFFNDKKYHRPTNVRSVRPSGSWTVIISMDGYEDWKESKDLKNGDQWIIDQELVKKK